MAARNGTEEEKKWLHSHLNIFSSFVYRIAVNSDGVGINETKGASKMGV